MKKKILLVILMLISLMLFGCSNTAKSATASTENSSMPEFSPSGGLPTPYVAYSLGEEMNNPYRRNPEVVDYSALSAASYRIRSVIECSRIYSSNEAVEQSDIIDGENKYGIEHFCAIKDEPFFYSVEDMRTVLKNSDYKSELKNNTGVSLSLKEYCIPAYIPMEYFMGTLCPLDKKANLQLYGENYMEDGNYYSAVWSTFFISDMPGADEITQLYAALNNLQMKSDDGPKGTVYHFTSKNGCAFFEKLGVETNDPATAYIWEQDGVLGVIILAGDYNPENLNLCVLEKHDL